MRHRRGGLMQVGFSSGGRPGGKCPNQRPYYVAAQSAPQLVFSGAPPCRFSYMRDTYSSVPDRVPWLGVILKRALCSSIEPKWKCTRFVLIKGLSFIALVQYTAGIILFLLCSCKPLRSLRPGHRASLFVLVILGQVL